MLLVRKKLTACFVGGLSNTFPCHFHLSNVCCHEEHYYADFRTPNCLMTFMTTLAENHQLDSNSTQLCTLNASESFCFYHGRIALIVVSICLTNSLIAMTVILGQTVCLRMLKCESLVTMYSASAATAQSTNLLSSGSASISPK